MRSLAAAMLVPGGIALLGEGDRVPADGQILSATAFQVDQNALTGESQPADKLAPALERCDTLPRFERPDLVFAGTSAVSGSATCVVTATGMETEIGAIAHLTQSVPEPQSPLQREMIRVTRVVSILALFFGATFLALGLASDRMDLSEGFFFALGVIVANVPEGLLPTLTLSLALGVQRMARRGSLLKRLSTAETLGSTTVICTDKTGTLTENRMVARFVWVSGRSVEASEISKPAGGADLDRPAGARFRSGSSELCGMENPASVPGDHGAAGGGPEVGRALVGGAPAGMKGQLVCGRLSCDGPGWRR